MPPPKLKLDAAKVSLTANTVIASHLDGLSSSVRTLERSERLAETFPVEEPRLECPEGAICEEPATPGRFDVSEESTELKGWLRDHVFNEAAVESTTETSVTYRLTPELMCPEETDDVGTVSRDADCVKLFTELPVRLEVTSSSEGDLDIALSAGEHRPLKVELYTAHIAFDADLDEGKAVLEKVAEIQEEELEGLPERFAGTLQVKLSRHAADDYTVALSILEALNVGLHDATHLEYFDARLAPATDAVSVRITQESGTVLSSLAFADIDLTAALDLLAGESESTTCTWNEQTQQEDCVTTTPEPKQGVVSLALAGISGEGNFDVDEDVLTLTGLGLGNEKAVAALDGTQFFGVTLNPQAGGVFDVIAASLEDGGRITVSPGLDLTVEHDLTALTEALADEESDVPAWLNAGSTSVNAIGAPDVAVRITEAPAAEECVEEVCPEPEPAQVQLEQGTVTLSASGGGDVVIEAPQCVVEVETDEEEPHPFEVVAGGACE